MNNNILLSEERYNRFKAGHPAGFIEAFANHYYDIADLILSDERLNSPFVFDIDDAIEGLNMLDAMRNSSESNTWVEVNK
ncbi:hypothetical protein [Vibrio nitrifigilis]|uniref:Oxidoreductase n=1 Tax=Vibrio nitrifigilis TaxID=2789781 RepID=A0ABS0GFH5_9VIBR|nr:hypothetical protein [Vibrio nitrifigilis]MBF9001161.1 hypothetical protein [Vibrio nitrifigilis]